MAKITSRGDTEARRWRDPSVSGTRNRYLVHTTRGRLLVQDVPGDGFRVLVSKVTAERAAEYAAGRGWVPA